MKRVTLSLEEEHVDVLDDLAEDRDESRSAAARHVLTTYEESMNSSQGEYENNMKTSYNQYEERMNVLTRALAEVERRLDEIERRDRSTPRTYTGGETDAEQLSEDAPKQDVDGLLEDWAHGRGEQERQASDEVAREALLWLREHGGEVRRADVPLAELRESDPLGRTEDTLWTQVVRAAFQHGAERGLVEQPTSRTYRWVGDVETE